MANPHLEKIINDIKEQEKVSDEDIALHLMKFGQLRQAEKRVADMQRAQLELLETSRTISRLSETQFVPDSRERWIHALLVKLTLLYQFNQAVYFKVDYENKQLMPVLAVGPDSEAEHHEAVLGIAGKKFLDFVREYAPGRFSIPFNRRVAAVRLGIEGIIQQVIKTGNSYLNTGFDESKLTETDKRIFDVFGTKEFAAVTLKGADKKVIGIAYANKRFTREPINMTRKELEIFDPYRYLMSTFLQLSESIEEAGRNERLAEIGMVFSRLNHDIRNSLSTIGGFARGISRHPKDIEHVMKNAGVILEEASRLEAHLNKTLNFVRETAPKKERFNVYDVVDNYISAVFKGAGLEYKLQGESRAEVYADPNNIKDVILNLINNARDAMMADKGKPANVFNAHIRTENGNYVVELSNPQYIPPENLRKMGSSFFTTKQKGTGFGLAISIKYLQANGGRLEFESSPEEGTIFRVYIPIAK